MNEKYISQKKILEYFNDNPTIKTMEVFISYMSDKHTRNLSIIKPMKILLKRQKEKMVDCFGDADIAFNEIDPTMFPIYTPNPKDIDTLYPLPAGIVTHFDWNVRCYDLEQNELEYSDDFMAKLKFFVNIKDAELNFIKMFNNYISTMGINDAMIEHNRIINKYTDIDPAQLLECI